AIPQRFFNRFDISQADCDWVLNDFAPDILHVEGAEMQYSRRFLSSWKGIRLLSMQGVLNGYSPYEMGRLPTLSVFDLRYPHVALTILVLAINRALRFNPRLKHERNAMLLSAHIMGRTLWDQAQAKWLNPDATYHHCSRVLRDVFYKKKWAIDSCNKFSIFIGNAAVPRKGAHFALHALALLKKDFPEVKMYFAGEDLANLPFHSIKKYFGYPAYLHYLIKKLGLDDSVVFTGLLGAEAMAEKMLESNVFLMSSVIENSPNTLGEAMMMGVPVVSAYAGGAPSMASDEHEALFYRADDPAMLAHQVKRIFYDDGLALRLSKAASNRAMITHSPDKNLEALVSAYKTILSEKD
ncbi:MAG: glycosyltransferase family 4 protein, partial [Methylotenera sp.]